MPSSTTNLCQAKASYKKTPGVLELTQTHIQWTASGKKTPDLRIPHARAACEILKGSCLVPCVPTFVFTALFCSKEGSAQVKLKLGLVGDDAGHMFTFTAPQAAATAEREAFKKELTIIIGNNRAVVNTSGEPFVAAPGTPTPLTSLNASAPRPLPVSRATSVSSNGRASSSAPSGATDDFRLRKKVLVKNPDLAALHKELVMSGQITESEFWEGREVSSFCAMAGRRP